jgi:hypothetical protein
LIVERLVKSEIRIEWAGQKLDQLELLIQRGISRALKTPVTELHGDSLKALSDLLFEVAPEGRRLISEYALHARTALDYVVYDLALHNTRRKQDGTQFPICKLKENFPKRPDGNGRGCLEHLTARQVALVERFQPYNGFPLLQLLHELSNEDKHRHFAEIEADRLITTVPTPQTDPVSGRTQMNVKFDSVFQITLERGRDAAKTLCQIQTHLTAILNEFNSLLSS